MEFHAYGDISNRKVLLLHGMLCGWRKFRELLCPLEDEFYCIYPAMTGCYDGSADFVSFADECAQIEEYVLQNFAGRLHAVWGASQGASVLCELLARNRLRIDTAVFDGVYLARQGRIAAALGLRAFQRMQKNGGQVSGMMRQACRLMGLRNEDLAEFSLMYHGSSLSGMKANLIENYTYHANENIRYSETYVHLWCGDREPYAKKSHRILKKYLMHYTEKIWPDAGHGVMLYFHTDLYLDELRRIFQQ